MPGTASIDLTSSSKPRHAGSCPQCGSLDVRPTRRGAAHCFDCGALSCDGEILRSGLVDVHYSLDVQSPEGRTLWCHTLEVLFEAQCDVAAGLRINPGSSFTKWLKTRERDGVIDDPETLGTMRRIVSKLMSHRRFIRDPFNAEMIGQLEGALIGAGRMVLTWRK